MKTKFENLAENPLDGIMVSASRRYQYTDIHIARLTVNNPGSIYDSLIADTRAKLDAYRGNLTDSKMKEAIRIASTKEIDDTSELFIDTVKRLEGLVKSVYPRGVPVYKQFFPYGLTEFHWSGKKKRLLLMNFIIKACQNNNDKIDTTSLLEIFTDVRDRFSDAFAVQQQANGIIVTGRSAKQVLWNDLKKQLYKNMLTILLNNLDYPRTMLSYFEPQLLRYHSHKANAKPSKIVLIAPLTTIVANLDFKATDIILIINHGTIPLYFYAAMTANQEAPPTLLIVPSGEEIEIKGSALGAPGNKFLLIMNKDEKEEGEVEYAVI